MQGYMIPNFHMGRIVRVEDKRVPLRTAVFMACVLGALAVEVLNLPPRFAFAMVFASLMTVCPDIWVDLPKSHHEELEDVRREIAALKRVKREVICDKV